MTCEILIMNRQALVLAADSSTTVTQWVNGKEEVRYFKGANKIFQISAHRPVGLMIYGSAALQRVPWEVIAKEFRRELGDKSFNTLEGYAQEFFEYIRNHAYFFPKDYQLRLFLEEVDKVATITIVLIRHLDGMKVAADDDKRKLITQYLDKTAAEVGAEPLPNHFTLDVINEARSAHKRQIEKEIEATLKVPMVQFDGLIDVGRLAEISINTLVKRYSKFMSSTGVVIAGFGEHDFFPSYHLYQCYGLLLGRLIADHEESIAIDHERPSHIKPFATTAMVDTFVLGFSRDVYTNVGNAIEGSVRNVLEDHKVQLASLDAYVTELANKYNAEWASTMVRAHAQPLRRVVGSLPVDEMAALAETLIQLESLKEKVTQPTESVGGPIDVAAISKGDNFIWIKRKHYFDPKLNPRYFARQTHDY